MERNTWWAGNCSPNRTPAAQEREADDLSHRLRDGAGDAVSQPDASRRSHWPSISPTYDAVAQAKARALKKTAGRLVEGALARTLLVLDTEPVVVERRGPASFVDTKPGRLRFVPPKPRVERVS